MEVLTVDQLKYLLRRRELPTSGRKSELIDRLTQYDSTDKYAYLNELSSEQIRTIILEVIRNKDTELLDYRGVFVAEFWNILGDKPYMFANDNDYWIYKRYTQNSPAYNRIKIPLKINMVTVMEVVFDKTSEIYRNLGYLIVTGDKKFVLQIWEENGKHPTNQNGSFYVADLLRINDSDTVKRMMRGGLDINAVVNDKTALFDLNPEIVRQLLELGADASYIDSQGHSFLYYYIKDIHHDIRGSRLSRYFEVLHPYKDQILPILGRQDILEAIASHEPNSYLIRNQINNLFTYYRLNFLNRIINPRNRIFP